MRLLMRLTNWLDAHLPLWRDMVGMRIIDTDRQVESIGLDWNIFGDEETCKTD